MLRNCNIFGLNCKLQLVFSWHHAAWNYAHLKNASCMLCSNGITGVNRQVVCMFVGILWTRERSHVPAIHIPASLGQVQGPP